MFFQRYEIRRLRERAEREGDEATESLCVRALVLDDGKAWDECVRMIELERARQREQRDR